jgi:hypothetical protein
MKRQPDGTWRRPNQARRVTARSMLARWVEAETLRLKQLGMSLERIAEHIVGVGHGRQKPMVELPGGLEFPPDYRISPQAVHRAFTRAMTRLPDTEAEAHRKLDTERCEDLFLALQPGIRKGDSKSVDVGVRVLEHKARINSYIGPTKLELAGRRGAIPIRLFQQAVEALDDEKPR